MFPVSVSESPKLKTDVKQAVVHEEIVAKTKTMIKNTSYNIKSEEECVAIISRPSEVK